MSSPAAFLSYTRFDDQHDEEELTRFCAKLGGAVRMVTGEPFEIFQDKRDIRVGQNWKQRVKETLDSTTLLIAIVTPSFFRSEQCADEMTQFLERETVLGRQDLIIPVYYVDVPGLNGRDPGPHGLFEVIRARQYCDWRELRFEPLESPPARRELNRLAVQIRDALQIIRERPAALAQPSLAAVQSEGVNPSRELTAPPVEPTIQTHRAVNQPVSITEPTTHVVDPLRGPYSTLQDAVAIASPGDRILVRPGTYDGGVVLDKTLEIIGQGRPEEVIIQAADGNALAFRTSLGRVANLTLRQLGGADYFAVDIGQGRLTLEGCRIESQSLAGIAIHGGGADPIIRNNRIHRCRQSGVVVFDGARGTLEENEIDDNEVCGVVIRDGNPMLRGNRIHDNQKGGVYAERGALGRLEGNDIFGNRREGVVIKDGANPVLRRNTVYDNARAGVYIFDLGQGTLEENEIRDNRQSGVAIRTEAKPTVRDNRIHDNNGKGVWCDDRAAGVVERNDLRQNKYGAFWKSPNCTTRYADNQE